METSRVPMPSLAGAVAGSILAWVMVPAPCLLLYGIRYPNGDVLYGPDAQNPAGFLVRGVAPLLLAGLLAGAISLRRPVVAAIDSVLLVALWAAASAGGLFLGNVTAASALVAVPPSWWTALLWLINLAAAAVGGLIARALPLRARRYTLLTLGLLLVVLLVPGPSLSISTAVPAGQAAFQSGIMAEFPGLMVSWASMLGQIALYVFIGAVAWPWVGLRAMAAAPVALVLAQFLAVHLGYWNWGAEPSVIVGGTQLLAFIAGAGGAYVTGFLPRRGAALHASPDDVRGAASSGPN